MKQLIACICKNIFTLMMCGLCITSFGQTENASRTALVIGNAAYTKPDAALKNSVSDARLMKQTLEGLNFEVIYREDVDRRGMQAAFRDFQDLVRKKKGVAAFYFAGHGVQVMGKNYIVPIGAHLKKDTDAQDSALDVDVMLQSVRDTGAQLNLFILDACRNNPLLATQRGDAGLATATGLAVMRPPTGALIAFATEPGRIAADGKDAGHGLYTKHLARWLKEPNLTLEQVFKRTREAVKIESGGSQIPTEYSLLIGADFYLTQDIKKADSLPLSKAKTNGPSRSANSEQSSNPRQINSLSIPELVSTMKKNQHQYLDYVASPEPKKNAELLLKELQKSTEKRAQN
jgi:Caspase domain